MTCLMRKQFLPAFVIATVFMYGAPADADTIASLADDFLEEPNQSNVATDQWQYYSISDITNRNGAYTLLPTFDTNFSHPDLDAWTTADANNLPAVLKNVGNIQVSVFVPGVFAMHPEAPSIGSAAAFLVPQTAIYDLSGTITDLDSGGGNGVIWFLDQNAGTTGNLDSGTITNGSSDSFSLASVSLTQGDLVYLIIGSNGNQNNDWTGATFEIAIVPEPASLGLLGFGIFALLRRRQRLVAAAPSHLIAHRRNL